ncbi:unnamed protein product, partial [Medioppia subpectinata]
MVPSVIVDSLKPSAAHQPLYVSLYRVTQESATHYARKLFALFDDNDYTTSSETSHDTSYNYITRRHMGSESSFGHVRSAGTRSPPLDTSTFYGQIIYESNYTDDYNGLALQQDGPTGATTGPMMSSTHKPSEMKDPMDPWGSSLLPSIKSDNKPVNTENGIFKPAVNVSTRIPILCGNISRRPNYPSVKCYPIPDAFNPCEDVMGNGFLRMLVWVVVIAAVLGNCAVMIVLM